VEAVEAGSVSPTGVFASASQLVRAIGDAASGAPSALRVAEGVVMAYVPHSSGGVSVVVNGELVARLSDGARAHVALLCGGHRVAARELSHAVRESDEVRQLVERLIRSDVLWAEM
jgi:hypothetical protein